MLSEEHVDLQQGGWQSGSPVTTGDRLRWLTNEGQEVFRAGQSQVAVQWYEEALRQAEADNWQREGQEPDFRVNWVEGRFVR